MSYRTILLRNTKYISLLLLGIVLGISGGTLSAMSYSQVYTREDNCKPSLCVSNCYVNRVYFDTPQNTYIFEYEGEDCNIKYRYTPTNGTLSDLITTYNDEFCFHISEGGGVAVEEIMPWKEGIRRECVSKLLHKEMGILETKWHYYNKEYDVYFKLKFSIKGKTLLLEAKSESRRISGFYLTHSQGTLSPRLISVPFLTYLAPSSDLLGILLTNNLFVSAFFDWTVSNASTLECYSNIQGVSSASFAQNAIYNYKTDGTRNTLGEKLYLTVSPDFNEVLLNLPNPRGNLEVIYDKVVFDQWLGRFSSDAEIITSAKSYGMDKVLFFKHQWQYGGYDNKLPSTYPADAINVHGGHEGMLNLCNTAKRCGYLFGLHENYVDFYENSPYGIPPM